MKPRFAIPAKPSETGGAKFERLVGKDVPADQRERVDRFIFGIPEGRARRVALHAVDRAREKNPAGFSDEEYFGILLKPSMLPGIVDARVIHMMGGMAFPVQANALRVAVCRCAEAAGGYASLEFYGDLIMDAEEHIAGEKVDSILRVVRGCGLPEGAVQSFSRWLQDANWEDVNLLYYKANWLERMVNAAPREVHNSREFVLLELVPKALEEARREHEKCPGMRFYTIEYSVESVAREARERLKAGN